MRILLKFHIAIGLLFASVSQAELPFTNPEVFKQCDNGVEPLPYLYQLNDGSIVYGCNNEIFSLDGAKLFTARNHFHMHFGDGVAFQSKLTRLENQNLRIETLAYPFFENEIVLNTHDYVTLGIVTAAGFKVGRNFIYEGDNGDGTQSIFVSSGSVSSIKTLMDAKVVSGVTRYDDAAIFQASANGKKEIFFTKGLPANTVRISSTECTPHSNYLGSLKSRYYFLCGRKAESDPAGEIYELWSTDGTKRGTTQIKLADDLRIRDFVGEINGKLIFSFLKNAGDQAEYGLAAADPNSLNVTELFSTSEEFNFTGKTLISKDGKFGYLALLFTARWPLYTILFYTDASQAGTRSVYEAPSNSIEPLAINGGYLFFTGDDEMHGVELWITDGTAAGSHIFADLNGGTGDSFPDNMLISGERIFFRARFSSEENAIFTFNSSIKCSACEPGDSLPEDVGLLPAPKKVKYKRKPGGYRFAMQKAPGAISYELFLQRSVIKKGVPKIRTRFIKSAKRVAKVKKLAAGKWIAVYRIKYGEEPSSFTKFSPVKKFKIKP